MFTTIMITTFTVIGIATTYKKVVDKTTKMANAYLKYRKENSDK